MNNQGFSFAKLDVAGNLLPTGKALPVHDAYA